MNNEPAWYVPPSHPRNGSLMIDDDVDILRCDGFLDKLPAWFHRPRYCNVEKPWKDPFFENAELRTVGAPTDPIDATGLIQGAIDELWDVFQQTGKHGFLYLEPGLYMADTIWPFYGMTIHAYGATIMRHGYDWYFEQMNGDHELAINRMRWAKLINGHGYHPRIQYKWRGPGISDPLRILGLTVDGNQANAGPFDQYEQEHAHLLNFSTDPGPDFNQPDHGDGQANVYLKDVVTQYGVADGVAIIHNVSAQIENYVSLDCFRAGITRLGSNNIVCGRNWYLSGERYIRGFDGEPQGTSAGFDYYLNRPLSPEQRSANDYWNVVDCVVGGGLDWATVVVPEDSNTYDGGKFVFERSYILRPKIFNLIPYAKEGVNDSAVVYFEDCVIHTGVTYPHIPYEESDSLHRWVHSSIRWPGNVEFVHTIFILDTPTDEQLARILPEGSSSKVNLTGFVLEMTSLASPWPEGQRWPNRKVSFSDCYFVTDDKLTQSAYRNRINAIAVSIKGDAASEHVVDFDNVHVEKYFDWGIHINGGKVTIRDGELDAKTYITALSRSPYGWTYDVTATGVGVAEYQVDPNAQGVLDWQP